MDYLENPCSDRRLILAPIGSETPSLTDAQTAPSAMKKRSVVIAGHRTSVSLEAAFWQALKAIAAGHRCTVNDLVTRIDRQRSGNLSSAIRVFVLETLSQRTHGRG